MPIEPRVVLVLGSSDDDHAVHMVRFLGERGARAHLLDGRQFPSQLRLSMSPDSRGRITFDDGTSLAWEQVTSIYWRCYNFVDPPAIADAEMATIAENDSRSLFESLLISMPVRWVNPWRAFELHKRKPAQLAMVQALDRPANLIIPATLQTNDPAAVRAFVAAHPHSIFKPVQGGAHTRTVTEEHISDQNLASLRFSPVTVQERIDGADIRVFVAGERVLACHIQTQATDFRDDPNAPISPVELPNDIAEAAIHIARALDLLWTGIDLKLAPDGPYYFLEANFSPMFMGFEARTGQPLTAALADVLLAPR